MYIGMDKKRRAKITASDTISYVYSTRSMLIELQRIGEEINNTLKKTAKPHKPRSRLIEVGIGLMFVPVPIVSEAAGAALVGAGALLSLKEKPLRITDINRELLKTVKKLKTSTGSF